MNDLKRGVLVGRLYKRNVAGTVKPGPVLGDYTNYFLPG